MIGPRVLVTLQFVFVAGAPIGVTGARAQDTLTLAEALAIAAEREPGIVQARNREHGAAVGRRRAWGRWLPAVTVSGGFRVTRSRSFTATDDFGDPTRSPEPVVATTRGADQAIGLSWTLFDGATRWFEVAASGRRRVAAAAATEARWNEIRAEVSTRYVAVLEARAVVEVERAILADRERDVETTESRFRIAAADRIDVLGARIEAVRQEAVVVEAVERARRAELALARAMGVGGRIEADLADLFDTFDPVELELEALRQLAVESHPELRRLAAEVGVAESRERTQGWWSYLPRIEVDASFRRNEFGGRGTSFFNLDPANSAWGFGITFSVPLFDRLARQAARAEARVDRWNAVEALRERRLEVESDVGIRWSELLVADRRWSAARAAVRLARERVRLARGSYRAGGLDFTRLQRVIDQATAAERTRIARRFEYHRSRVELGQAIGRAVKWDGTK